MSEQLGYPLAVHHVGLTARDRLDVLSVSKHHMEVLFEHVPNRLPIDASRLHGDIPDLKAPEPLSQLSKVSRRATEAAKMLPRLMLLLEQNTCRNRRLMHIDTATSLVKHFHPCLLCRARKDAKCESLPRVLFRKEGYSPLFLNASRVKLISGFKTPLQVTTSCGHDHNSLTRRP